MQNTGRSDPSPAAPARLKKRNGSGCLKGFTALQAGPRGPWSRRLCGGSPTRPESEPLSSSTLPGAGFGVILNFLN